MPFNAAALWLIIHNSTVLFFLVANVPDDANAAEALVFWGISEKWVHVSNHKLGPWVLMFQEFVRADGNDLENSGALGEDIALKEIARKIYIGTFGNNDLNIWPCYQ